MFMYRIDKHIIRSKISSVRESYRYKNERNLGKKNPVMSNLNWCYQYELHIFQKRISCSTHRKWPEARMSQEQWAYLVPRSCSFYHSLWKKQLIPDVKRENIKWTWDNLVPKHKETLEDQPDSVLKGLESPTV